MCGDGQIGYLCFVFVHHAGTDAGCCLDWQRIYIVAINEFQRLVRIKRRAVTLGWTSSRDNPLLVLLPTPVCDLMIRRGEVDEPRQTANGGSAFALVVRSNCLRLLKGVSCGGSRVKAD